MRTIPINNSNRNVVNKALISVLEAFSTVSLKRLFG